MLKPELYEKTVNILVDAYFNDTLEHSNCCACAVGNLVAAANGVGFIESDFTNSSVIIKWDNGKYPSWDDVFSTAYGRQSFNPEAFNGKAEREILSTGYELNELARIEYAFETAPKGCDDDEWMFSGLMSVIEVLDIIHQNTDSNVTASTKQRFVKI